MRDFDNQLEELVAKFGVYIKIPETYDYLDMYNQYVEELLMTCKALSGKRVGFYGIGTKTKQTLDLICRTKGLNIVCLVDNDEEKRAEFHEKCETENLPSIPIISSEKIADYNVETILVMTFNSRKAIKEHVEKLYPGIIIYDVYERLEKKGLIYKMEFFRNGSLWLNERFIRHKYVYSYMTASELEEKKKLLEAVIYMHVCIRDFYNVDRFIRDYIFLGFDINDKYSMFLKELKLIFNEMFEISCKKKNNSIAIFVVDCLTHDDYQHMPFTRSLMRDKGVVFEKAYSNASWTTSSYDSLLSGKDIIQGKMYRSESFSEDGLGKIKDIVNEGYDLSTLRTHYTKKKQENQAAV